MFRSEFQIRTRYAETDQMGYIYYGHYLTYLEVARTEAIKSLGLSYRQFEEELEIMLPVAEAFVQYKAPAKYDDLLTIKTLIKDKPSGKIRFDSEIYNQDNILLATAYVILVFVSKKTMKPTRPPDAFIRLINKYWN